MKWSIQVFQALLIRKLEFLSPKSAFLLRKEFVRLARLVSDAFILKLLLSYLTLFVNEALTWATSSNVRGITIKQLFLLKHCAARYIRITYCISRFIIGCFDSLVNHQKQKMTRSLSLLHVPLKRTLVNHQATAAKCFQLALFLLLYHQAPSAYYM